MRGSSSRLLAEAAAGLVGLGIDSFITSIAAPFSYAGRPITGLVLRSQGVRCGDST